MIQEERSVFWEVTVSVIVKKKGSYEHVSNFNKKVQLDATVCRYLFTAQSLYMFRASQHPSSGVLKTVSATSGYRS